MRVEVLINGFFGERFAREHLVLELVEGSTLRELASELRRRTGLDPSRLQGTGATLMLSGRRVVLPADMDAPLQDGDLLAVLSPLAGG